MAEKEVMSLSQFPKNELIDLIKKLKLCLDKHDELTEEKDMIISNIIEENNKWAEKATRLESQIADVPPRDKTLKVENLKLQDEICMLKTENLKLVNDLKAACISNDEKKKAWEKDAISTKIAKEAEHYAKRFMLQRMGQGYDNAPSSHGVPNNVPIVVPQATACKGTQGTSAV